MLNGTFATKVFKYRTDRGYSQEEFAHIVGVSFGTINNWEKGKTKPKGLQKKMIERILSHPKPTGDSR